MIRPANIPYIKGSVMTLCIVASITLSGLFRIVDPGSVSTSSALQKLPGWVLLWLNFAWLSSGVITVVGIVLGQRRTEAAGLMLMATAFFSYFVAILLFKGDSALSVLYVFGYALGAILRSHYLLSENIRLIATARRQR